MADQVGLGVVDVGFHLGRQFVDGGADHDRLLGRYLTAQALCVSWIRSVIARAWATSPAAAPGDIRQLVTRCALVDDAPATAAKVALVDLADQAGDELVQAGLARQCLA